MPFDAAGATQWYEAELPVAETEMKRIMSLPLFLVLPRAIPWGEAHVAVLDVEMPGMDGFELARAIKAAFGGGGRGDRGRAAAG